MGRRLASIALLLAILSPPAIAAGRDPDYDRVLEAYKARRWTEFDRLAEAFLKEKPDYRFAHSVRFMRADSLRQRKLLPEAAAAFEDYLRRHPDATLADRSRGALIGVLNEDGRHAEALERARAYLARHPKGAARARVVYERAIALEGLRRFEEAAAAFDGIEGKYREAAQFRRGVALFRGRAFAEAKKALSRFLERFPGSSYERRARDYLFRADAPYTEIRDGIVSWYEGKYTADPRLADLRKRLPRLRREALDRIRDRLGVEVPETFLIRFADAGRDRSGNFASTRLEVVKGRPRQVLVLYTEYLLTGCFDLPRTLTHELYHCLQRDRLGEDHYRVPKWVREGSALYVAGQTEARTRQLVAELGRRPEVADPLARLVNGLGGRHRFDDYAEDAAAFAGAEERHGKRKVVELLRRLLTTPDVAAAVKATLGEDLSTFERRTAEFARRTIAPLLAPGRDAIREAARKIGKGRPEEALSLLPRDPGVYAAPAVYLKALAHLNAGRPGEALAVIRKEYYPVHRPFAPLTDNAMLIEVKALRALSDPEYEAVAERALKDLEPTSAYRALLRVTGN